MPNHGQLGSDAITGSLSVGGKKVLDATGKNLFLGKYKVLGPRITASPGAPASTAPFTLPNGTATGASNAANSIIAVLQTHGLIS